MISFIQLYCLLLWLSIFRVENGPHKTIDVRKFTEPDGAEYSLCFCARPSPNTSQNLPGHAFVAYSLLPKSGPRQYLAVGHTTSAPAVSALLTYLGIYPSVAGSIDEEIFTAAKEKCLVLKVNKNQYDTALLTAKDAVTNQLPSFTDQRKTILSYTLGSQDCMGFMLIILKPFANQNQVKVPKRGATELPLTYLRRLIDYN